MAATHPTTRRSAVPLPSMQVDPLTPNDHHSSFQSHTARPTPLQAANGPESSVAHFSSIPPPGARAPMIRRASRFDPMEGTPEEDNHGELGPRHPLRRIREDPGAPPPGPSPTERKRIDANNGNGGNNNNNNNTAAVSLPGIKALLNAADQPPLVSPFGGSFFQPSSASTSSPLNSPTRGSRYSSLTSSAGAESQPGAGWWAAADDRSSSSGPSIAGPVQSRSSSYSGRGAHLEDDGPEYKRRRSDLAPIPADADETARLKWQAQSRNASFPVSASISSASSLRSMLYPPPAPSSSRSRTSISHTPLASSPLSGESPFEHHISSSRGSPMAAPMTRSFADLSASELSPSQTPSRPRSPTDRRPSLFPRGSISLEPLTLTDRRGSAASLPGPSSQDPASQRMSVTRPPSPEPAAQAPRRSSLAELIKASSGDDVALANGGRFFTPSTGSKRVHPDDQLPPTWSSRRESADSIRSIASLPGSSSFTSQEAGPSMSRDRRNASGPGRPIPPRRPVDDDEAPESKASDPGMHGMEVLARVADAERLDQEDKKPSPGINGRPPAKNGAVKSASTSTPSAANEASGSADAPGSGPKYCCDYCGKSFSRPSSLRIHIYSHTGERPFICSEPQCGRSFSVQSNLKRHAKVHEQAQQAAAQAAQNIAVQQEQAAQQMAAAHQQQQQLQGPPPHMGHGLPHQQVYGYSVRPNQQPHPGHPGQQQQHHPHMVHPHHPQHGYGPPPPGFMPPQPGHPYQHQPHPVHHPGHHYAPQHMRPRLGPGGPPGLPHDHPHRAMHHHEMEMSQRRREENARYAPRGGGGPEYSGSEEEDELDELDEDER